MVDALFLVLTFSTPEERFGAPGSVNTYETPPEKPLLSKTCEHGSVAWMRDGEGRNH